MRKPKISLVISGILFLLVGFLALYTFYLTESFSSTDREVVKMTEQQMSTILLSLNQYTEDIVGNIVTRVSIIAGSTSGRNIAAEQFRQLQRETEYITDIIIADSAEALSGNGHSLNSRHYKDYTKLRFADDNTFPLKKLFDYARNGYRKIENTVIARDTAAFYFLIENQSGGYNLYYIQINPITFASVYLQQKISGLAGEQYSVELTHPKFGVLLAAPLALKSDLSVTSPFRMLSGYNFTISPSGNTLAYTVQERSKFNLVLIILVNFLLVAGIIVFWYIFRREMKLAQLKTDFVANVSHELRTPLSLISMFSESLLLGRVKNEEKQKEYYSIIQSETGRLSGLVNKILNFSQLDAGKKKFVMEDFDLHELLSKIYHTYEYHLSQKGFRSSFLPASGEAIIHGDKTAIEEVCINLIDNAMKYSSEVKEVSISTKIDNSSVSISVSDKGVGISGEDQKHVFDKFFRAGSSLIHTTKGTGLGLSIVKQIVDIHGGQIAVSSEPGKGSTFTVKLLRVQGDVQ